MKKTIILILTLSLILAVFSSCGHKTVDPIDNQTSSSPSEDKSAENTENVISDSTESYEVNQSDNTETDDRLTNITSETIIEYPASYNYTIKKVNGNWYMDFDSYATRGDQKLIGAVLEIPFRSLSELYSHIVNNDFPQIYLMKFIDNWRRTEHGIKIINFDELYIPVLPETMEYGEGVIWIGDSFSLWARDINNKETTAQIAPISAETFENIKTDTYRVGTGIGRKIVTSGDKTIIVRYTNYSGKISGPCIYLQHQNVYFKIDFQTNFIEMPSDDFLLQFGVEKFQTPQ